MLAKVQAFTIASDGYSAFAGIPEAETFRERALHRPRKPAISGRPYKLVLLCACRDDVGQSPV
jgi:hypothetical protein